MTSYSDLDYDPRFGNPYQDDPTSSQPSFDAGIERTDNEEQSIRIPDRLKLRKQLRQDELHTGRVSRARKQWLYFCACMTFWIPDIFLKWAGMTTKDTQQAWREKFALVEIIIILSLFTVIWLEASASIFCPGLVGTLTTQDVISSNHLVIANGKVLDLNQSRTKLGNILREFVGKDVTSMFPAYARYLGHPATAVDRYEDPAIQNCVLHPRVADTFVTKRVESDWAKNLLIDTNGNLRGCRKPGTRTEIVGCYYSKDAFEDLDRMAVAELFHFRSGIKKAIKNIDFPDLTIVNNRVYDVSDYIRNVFDVNYTALPESTNYTNIQPKVLPSSMFMAPDFSMALLRNIGKDGTEEITRVPGYSTSLECLDRLYYAGAVKPIFFFQLCELGNPILLICSAAVYAMVLLKFFLSLNCCYRVDTTNLSAYCMLFVPCYTEGLSMKVTFETLATTDYDDRRKLLMVVCDGDLTGKGNAKPTPRIACDIVGWEGEEPTPKEYVALGKGEQKLNMAKIYHGIYHYQGHMVPYMIIAKVGKESETAKPGNRGKRDSQIMLMKFANKLCRQDSKLNPFEYELYFLLKHVVGVHPELYEYVLMVDADTQVYSQSLKELVGACVHDERKIGVCGETKVANKWASWVTMIQVHEYFINHHMGKSFESLFGSVTCLPGCFTMYRMRYLDGRPALVTDKIIEDYSINRVSTLHDKNLLHLGEDRYLTTLILTQFPDKRLEFVPTAFCKTDIPDSFDVLLSQRRRWINSTFHNLYELLLVDNLCGFLFLNMRVMVFLDFLATMVLPATTVYLYFIFVRVFIEGISVYLFIVLGFVALYATHLIIILFVKRKYEYILWIFIYMFAGMPIYSVVLPVYAFWHFDDFSWGSTRQVKSEKAAQEDSEYDPLQQAKAMAMKPFLELEAEDPRLNEKRETYFDYITRMDPQHTFNSKAPAPGPTKESPSGANLLIDDSVPMSELDSPVSGSPRSPRPLVRRSIA